MILKVEVESNIGAGITLHFHYEAPVDSTEEAEQQGEEFNIFCQAFSKGYGSAPND